MTDKQSTVVVSRELRSVLAMVLNALDRDAAEGKAARGEMAQELRALLAAPVERHNDTFNGDNNKLASCIAALLQLDASGALVPHGIGGHARTLLDSSAARLMTQYQAQPVERQAEPVAWMYRRQGGEILGQLVQMESEELRNIRLGKCYDNGTRYLWPREDYIDWKPLYLHAQPPANGYVTRLAYEAMQSEVARLSAQTPAKVVLPERMTKTERSSEEYDAHADSWNACLDEVAKLNPSE